MEAKARMELIQSEDQFYALQQDWDELIQNAEDASIFVSWDWQYYWWRHYGRGQKLRLVIARQGERVVGILPLYIKTIKLFRVVPVKVLQFIGTGGDTSPEYLGPVIDSNVSAKLYDELVVYALGSMQGWDVLHLNEISTGSRLHNVLTEHCAKERLPYRVDIHSPNAYIAFPDTWEKFLSALSSNRRWQTRRKRRRFGELDDSRFFVWNDDSQLQTAIERLIALHHTRWLGTQECSFSSSEYVGFHTDLMHALIKKGNLRLYCLEAEGKIIAMDYCYLWRGEIMLFQRGFDPAYDKYSPGSVLLAYQIEHAIGEHCKGYDFLRGDHKYKQYIANDAREKVAIKSYRFSPASTLYRLRTEHIPEFKKSVLTSLKGLKRIGFRSAVRA